MNRNISWIACAISAIAIVSACATRLAAQATEAGPFTGTWKLNIAKSKFNPGPAPKSQTVTIAPDGKISVEGIESDGKSTSWSFTPSGDTAVPVEGLENTTVIEKRTGNVLEFTWNGGKVKGRSVLSNHGKTATYTQTGTDKDGHPIHNVQIYDRVS